MYMQFTDLFGQAEYLQLWMPLYDAKPLYGVVPMSALIQAEAFGSSIYYVQPVLGMGYN